MRYVLISLWIFTFDIILFLLASQISYHIINKKNADSHQFYLFKDSLHPSSSPT